MAPKRILAYGEDSLVISTRSMILERAGYDVAHTTRVGDLMPLLKGIFFDMLLIGDSLRTRENVRLVEHIREQFPNLLIAMVQDEREERDPWSTAFVSSNPEQMLDSIRALFDGDRKPVGSITDFRLRAMHTVAGR